MGQESSNWDQKQVILATAAGVFFLVAILFTAVISGTNDVTGTDTHPLAWLGWIAWIALLGCMALGLVFSRSGSK